MKAILFAKRNVKEMVRDPILYIFCLGFPIGMLLLFALINHFSANAVAGFEPVSLVPGVMMFSFTFVMLTVSLLVSKDRSTAFLKRLYTSPLRAFDYSLGYGLPCIVIGVIQAGVTVLTGWILSVLLKQPYFSFGQAVLLILSQLPILLFCISLGLIFGTLLSETSAPGITSVFITASGILGGAWMPLDTMGSFETICRFLPFYPSVYLGRIITGASHTLPNAAGLTDFYAFDNVAKLGLIPLILYTVAAIIGSFLVMQAEMHKDH